MSSEVDRDQSWIGSHCDPIADVSPQCDVSLDEQRRPETKEESTSGRVLNGRSPSPSPVGECFRSGSATLVPEVKEGSWSPPEAESRRGSSESDCLSDASATSAPRLEDSRTESLNGDKVREVRDAIVVSDSSPTPPPPNLLAVPEPQINAVLPSPKSAAVSAVSVESVVSKLESFVESMSVRRCVKSSTLGLTDTVTLSTSGLGRQSYPACRPLPTLNGLRGNGSGVLLPFYVPFKTSDMVDHPLDLSSKTSPIGRTSMTKTDPAAFVQAEDEPSEVCDEATSSLESLQKQFGENSAMLDRIGVRRHSVSGVAALGNLGARIHGAISPLNGVGLYGPALNEPCVPPSACRPVPVPHPDASRCAQTSYDPARSPQADRRAARRLVRGQDAWMNGVCGRQRRSSVLRCLECNMSFWSLPELTLHMIKTAHYANIVRSSVVPGPTPEMTSSPTMTSSCSPADSDSSRDSDVDNDNYFGQTAFAGSEFRLAKSAKRQREYSLNGDEYSKKSKIWRPDCPLPTSHCSAAVERPVYRSTSADGRVTPVCGEADARRLSALEHDGGAVTTSKLTEDRDLVAPLYDRSPVRSEVASDDGEATRQPALTAMEDFISRSICELDRTKRRPAMPLLPPPVPPPRPPTLPNGLPPTMSVADLMFPLFPLAQFFPEQFLIASRAFNFLPLMQSLARLYGDRFAAWDAPLGAPAEFPGPKTSPDFDTAKRPPRHRTPEDAARDEHDRRGDSAKCQRVNGGEPEIKSHNRDRHDVELQRSTSNSDNLCGASRDADDCKKRSPTSSHLAGDGNPSTALDSLRGFVYGDRKRKYSREGYMPHVGGGPDDDENARRRPGQSPPISSPADSAPGAPSPAADCPETVKLCGVGGPSRTTTDYDCRFDKYYRLARELAGQL